MTPSKRFAPATWHVFDGDRVFNGRVDTPVGFMLMAVVNGEVTGVWRDEWGVEYVRVYRLRPQGE